MKVYFVTVGLREEIEVIRKVRPPRLLCSYWYFKNKPMAEFCEDLGYRPEILLDSGAYSAFTKGKNVNVLDYIQYIKDNQDHITRYISLDVIGNQKATLLLWWLMQDMDLQPVPVVHYGDAMCTLDYYLEKGARLVALGGTVPLHDKRVVAAWCVGVKQRCPDADLHLLGSSSQKIIDCGAVSSCDSSAWYAMAVNGKPQSIPGKTKQSKIARAEANMIRIMEEFNEISVPFDNCCGECSDSKI